MEEKLVVFELAGAAYLRGIGKVGEERVIILLDLTRIFSQDEQ